MENKVMNSTFGLDRKQVEAALNNFLDSKNEAKVFAIKGDWGIGKTYLVKKILNEKRQNYSYASIFGLEATEQLKRDLFLNFQLQSPSQSKKQASGWLRFPKWRDSSNQNKQNIEEILKSLLEVGLENSNPDIPSKVVLSAINIMVDTFLNEKLICIDDIERKLDRFSLANLFGFIEVLTELKNCKVILIYNEKNLLENLDNNTLMKSYREKVIDYEINFSPSTLENFSIVFNKNYPEEDVILNYIQKENIQSRNIRILKKLKYNIECFREHIKDKFSTSIWRNIVSEIIFCTLSKFDRNFPIDLEKIRLLGPIGNGEFSTPISKENYNNIYLNAISLGYTDSVISSEIVNFIETGTCNFDKICRECIRRNSIEQHEQVQKKLGEALKPYGASFSKESEKELSKNLLELLDGYVTSLNFQQIKDIGNILNAINPSLNEVFQKYQMRWMSHQVESSKTDQERYQLRSIIQKDSSFSSEDVKSTLNDIDKKLKQTSETMEISGLLLKLLREKSLSEKESEYLNGLTVNECKEWLLQSHNDKYFMVKAGLNNIQGRFSRNLKKAIEELAQESDLNALRAEKIYGISIKEN